MKKFASLVILFALICVLTACGSNNSQIETNDTDSYHLFHSMSSVKYLNFLENFDHDKYEIVDISRDNSYWYVTYRQVTD